MTSLQIELEGTDLPGRRWGPDPERACYENIHVGLRHRNETIQLVPGNAPSATWRLEVTVRGEPGSFDFGGPYVQGPRGERHLSLHWVTLADDGTCQRFRGAKLRCSDIEPATLLKAMQPGKRLIGRLGLTGAKGGPRCASVRPPDIIWSVGSA